MAFGKSAVVLLNILIIIALFGPIVSNLIIVGDMGVITGISYNPHIKYSARLVKFLTILLGTVLIAKPCLTRKMSPWLINVTSVTSIISSALFLLFLVLRLFQ